MVKFISKYWNDKNISIYKIDNRFIGLYGWNGEKYLHCFELDNTLHNLIKDNIEVIPLYKDLKNGDLKIINYKIIGE